MIPCARNMKRNSTKAAAEVEDVRKTVQLPEDLKDFAMEESRKLPGASKRGNLSAYVRVLIEQARGRKGSAA